MILPLRAILIGDRLPFGRVVVDRITHGESRENPDYVELIFNDGLIYEGNPDITLSVIDVAIDPNMDRLLYA